MHAAGANRFLTVDLHNGAEASFCPRGTILDELSADKYLVHFIRQNVPGCYQDKMFVCATVGGGLPFARHIASVLGCFFGMCDRFRAKAGGNRGEVRVISDSNIQEAEAVVVIDDMVDTGGSFGEAVAAVRSAAPGAKLYGLAAHGYFSGEAHLEVRNSVQKCGLEWLAVTNTVSQASMQRRLSSVGMEDRLKVVDISRLVAGAIVRIHLGESVNTRKFKDLSPSERDANLPTLDGGVSEEQPKLGLSSSKEEVTI
jgi:ribose-phosphate pyrophosphokinase